MRLLLNMAAHACSLDKAMKLYARIQRLDQVAGMVQGYRPPNPLTAERRNMFDGAGDAKR